MSNKQNDHYNETVEEQRQENCKHKNVEEIDMPCNHCGVQEGYCKDCDAEMCRDSMRNEWEEA